MRFSIEHTLPKELLAFKVKHYMDVLGNRWQEVYDLGKPADKIVVMKDKGKIVGGAMIDYGTYALQFRNFAILPGNRGKGYAHTLMSELERIALEHHQRLVITGKKYSEMDVMYLQSMVYLDAPESLDPTSLVPAQYFAPFLRQMGFEPHQYNKHTISDEETVALGVFEDLDPDLMQYARVFKKPIVNNVRLRAGIREELQSLTRREWDIVIGGLNWKLGNYGKTGRVSYRYDICPICEDVGSTEEDSDNCKKCYINTTCREPFKEGFKADYEVSHAYFSAIREYLLSHTRKKPS